MLERENMQSTGFRNTESGFELRIRAPNYRGMRLSLIEGVDVIVDGENFAAQQNSIIYDGVAYNFEQLAEATEIRWEVGTTITLRVEKPGGLEPGVHEVTTVVNCRHPYFPPRFQPIGMRATRHATIIF